MKFVTILFLVVCVSVVLAKPAGKTDHSAARDKRGLSPADKAEHDKKAERYKTICSGCNSDEVLHKPGTFTQAGARDEDTCFLCKQVKDLHDGMMSAHAAHGKH